MLLVFNSFKTNITRVFMGSKKGLAIVQGAWINFLDGGDILLGDFLALILKSIEAFPTCQFSHQAIIFVALMVAIPGMHSITRRKDHFF